MTSAANLIAAARQRGQTALSEAESKAVLAAYGLQVTREAVATSVAGALAAAAHVGYPVAVKGCHWTIQHKTETDMVRLGIVDEAALRAAAADLLGRVPAGGQLLIQEMVAGKRELLLGVTRDPQFGPCVTVGIGGIFAEALQDVSFRVAPVDGIEARAMLGELKLAVLLGPFRGMPPADGAALEQALVGLSRLVMDHPEISAIDVNPVILAGSRPVAVDALILLDRT